MAIRDIFKKFKEDKSSFRPSPSKEGSEKKESSKEEAKPIKETKPIEEAPLPLKRKKKRARTRSYYLLKTPHVTEKATDLAGINQYVFKVWPKANKTEIKKAIESLYGADVLNVKIINVAPKKRRLGRISGWRKGYKKAIVRIKEGQKIEILPR